MCLFHLQLLSSTSITGPLHTQRVDILLVLQLYHAYNMLLMLVYEQLKWISLLTSIEDLGEFNYGLHS